MKIDIAEGMFLKAYLPFLFDYDKRYEVYYGGAGSGKSYFITQKILLKLIKEPKRKCLVVRKVGATIRDSVFQLFIDVISQWSLSDYVKVNKSTFTIELFNGSKIICRGCDDPEKIKSIAGLTDIWIEECSECNEEDILQLDLRLRAKRKNLQMYFSFNPVSMQSWVYRKWFKEGYDKSNTMVLKTTYKDNDKLPPEYVRQLEEKIHSNTYWYKVYALGEFAVLDKLVFTDVEQKEFDYHNITGTHLVGIDFGFTNDPSTIIDSILDEKNKTIYICNEYFGKGRTNDELAKVIKDMGLSKSTIIADSAEQKSIEEIKRLGIYNIHAAKKGPDSIMHGIQKLQQYHIVISTNCPEIYTEFQNYTWQRDKSDSSQYINKPIDSFNHGIDALRYSLQCVNSQIGIGSKNILF